MLISVTDAKVLIFHRSGLEVPKNFISDICSRSIVLSKHFCFERLGHVPIGDFGLSNLPIFYM